MDDKKQIENAKHYYDILKRNVELFNINTEISFISFEGFCDYLKGHNFEWWNDEESEGLFDINFGNICATIVYKKGKCRLSKSVEIWDDEVGTCLDDDYIME